MTRSLRHGREHVAIPGPSVIPDRVLAAMHRAMPNIYEGELIETSLSVLEELPAIARTEGEVFVTVSNGHGTWDMALGNTLSRGDRILVLESGVFARSWGQSGATAGVTIQTLPGSEREPVDPAAVEEALRADTERAIKAVLVVHVDTATSVRNDIPAIRKAIDDASHPALLMVDCIASLGCDPYWMDEWGVDVTVGAAQKGLMVPPGLGFVWAGPKAMAAHQSADLRSGYWDWGPRRGTGPHYLRYAGTPPIQHIWALRTALDMLADEGLENIWWRHEVLAGAVWAAVDAWSENGAIELNIADRAHRSTGVTTVRFDRANELRAQARDQASLIVGVALEGFDDRAFRIGHMGHLNPPMLLGTLGTLEAVLANLGVAGPRSGVGAAAAHLAKYLDGSATP